MRYQKSLRHGFALKLIVVIALSVLGCGTQQPEAACEAPPQEGSASTDPKNLWKDATKTTIGATKEWTNKVELADIDGDRLVDILFANGSGYNMIQLGVASDTPVPADYDGDRKADPAFYRDGQWQIIAAQDYLVPAGRR